MLSAKYAVPFAFIALASCSTPYQEMGLLGGVSATQIDATTMRISSRGNGFSDIGRMKDYVLLKAAEETVKRGYDFFEVVGAENVSRTDHVAIPEFHSQPVLATGFGSHGPVTVFGSVNYTTERDEAINKPGEDILIHMFRGAKPADAAPNLFAAREIIAFLGPQIRPDANWAAMASAAPASTGIAPSPAPQPAGPHACAAEDKKLMQAAREKDYRYSVDCQ